MDTAAKEVKAVLRRLCAILLMLLCLVASTAFAATQGHDITKDGGIYYATIEENGRQIRFPVYCMNRLLKWPVPDEEYWLDTDYLNQYSGLYESVQRLLFVGFPTNGLNLYTLGEKVTITEAGYNRMLEVPDFILNFTNGGAGRFFDLADANGNAVVIKADGTGRDKAEAFITKLLSGAVSGEDKRLMVGSNFYSAVFHLQNNAWNVVEAIKDLEKSLQPNEYNMWQSTQVAMYQLLKDYNVPDNMDVNLGSYPYAQEMYNFAKNTQPAILLTEPGDIQLRGSAVFRLNTDDGLWYSSEMEIVRMENFDALYELDMPQGYTCTVQKLRAGQRFRLVSDHMPEAADQIKITAEVRWPSDLYHFSPEKEESAHQHMGGVYYNSRMLEKELTVAVSAPKVPKTGDGTQVYLLMMLMAVSAGIMLRMNTPQKRA